ncbi:GNAT family N-acetyltransferase [Azospirillum picis]|uniref:GNAT family acetyltransferase n=1 Tax=Azospirillum picis TaxID=488438 RepID=A0ABU0MMD1_9PROT|nr:GNAT family N-acetyltransferase [Azospirillum picis]MBP2300658.1 putative GNAT family acetyltransferase [Azospirillum picis]MDQ0534627.1 putative GNAT family acetyltransferase [Azospirillum picis]
MDAKVRNNTAHSRYELTVDDATAVAVYEIRDGAIAFTHTEVPRSLSGQGVGSALARGALDDARAAGKKVVPLCSFIAAYIERHPEYKDLT